MLARRTRLLAVVLAAALLPSAAALSQGPPHRGGEPAAHDRFSIANRCFALRATATGRHVAKAGETFSATAADPAAAEPFHLRAFDLGKYLLLARGDTFLASETPPLPDGVRPVTDPGQGVARGTLDEHLDAARDPAVGAVDVAEDVADDALQPLQAQAAGDGVVVADEPSAAAEWVVRESVDGAFTFHVAADDHEPANPGPLDPELVGTLTSNAEGELSVVDGVATTAAARFALVPASGCGTWPEVELNVGGAHHAGTTLYEEARGYVDAHLHMMAFEFIGGQVRCGRPWHPYGVEYALVDCADHEAGGRGAVLEQFLSGQNPGDAHDTAGWPEFTYWPRHNSLTHEQVYYRWLERAWRGGLRMFTNLLVDNGVLCELYPIKRNSCNEMDGVRLQAQRLRELERYIDAQHGGPGQGWFRIVTDPFEARRVVNAGKLAVVMGIEVSVPLDCGEHMDLPHCTTADMERRLQEVYDIGVRQMELTNKFDNAFTGVTGDSAAFGVVVNQGNKYETGQHWKMETCDEVAGHGEHDHRHDKLQDNLLDHDPSGQGRDSIFAGVLEVVGGTGAAPVYPPGPHCNAQALSPLGVDAINGMIRRGMIFDPDHMSALARKQAMEVIRRAGYSGVVSSHSWADDPTYREILAAGGVVTPHAGGAESFVRQDWTSLRSWADPRFVFGLGFGSDVNGFSKQGAPRTPPETSDVDYPFTGLGGVVVDRQVSGEQTYDINLDGVDHYGLYPDWVEDVRTIAGENGAAIVADLERAVEAYLQMWERAVGVPGDACREDLPDLTKAQLKALDKGMTVESVLRAIGQPVSRVGEVFTYCVDGRRESVEFRDGALRKA